MSASSLSPVRVLACAAAAAALSGPLVAAEPKIPLETFPSFESYIKVSGATADIKGSESTFAKRVQRPTNGAYGIEALHLARDFRELTLTVDGRALEAAEDYLLRVQLAKADFGSLETGYKRFRTFYDGIGGFFPINKLWLTLGEQELHTDRGRFWARLALEKENLPKVELQYVNETRSGRKSSTIWGDTNRTGLPTVPANNATRKIAPAYLELDERHQTLEASVRHQFGSTTALVRLAKEKVDNVDTRFMTRFPREVTPSPERKSYQMDGLINDSASVMGTTETVLNDQLTVTTGFSYQKTDGEVSGERPNAIGVTPTYDFKDLAGKSEGKVYTANAAVQYRPNASWVIQPALRWEDSYIKSAGTFNRVALTNNRLVTTAFKTASRFKETVLTPDLSLRYTGIPKLALYSTVTTRLTTGDNRHTDQYSTTVPTVAQQHFDDVDQDQAQSKLGANWNPSSLLTLRAEIFHKDHENQFIGYANQLGSRYVVGYKFTGVKATAIVKPIPQLSFTTRYQPQVGKMNVTTAETDTFESMDARSHLLSETIDWNPTPRFYAQAAVNLVYHVIATEYPYNQAPATIARQRNSDNNYWTASVLSGFVVDKKTDAILQYTYQRADNFDADFARIAQPYGSGYEEYTVTATLKRKLAERWLGTLKVGYIYSRSDTTGGNTDFHGPLAYLGIEYGL